MRRFAAIFVIAMTVCLGLVPISAVTAHGPDRDGDGISVIVHTAKPYDNIRNRIRGMGGDVTIEYVNADAVAVRVPADKLSELMALPEVEAVEKDYMVPMPEARGTVRQVSIDDPQDNFVMVELEAAPRRSLLGPVAIFENDGQQDAAYTIQSLRRSGKLHRLSVGDKTFIRGYSNPRDFDSDFVLNVQPGDTVRIPGSVCFS